MSLEKQFVFFFKRSLLMMFFLLTNVSNRLIQQGWTYGKRAVSVLPREACVILIQLSNPLAAIRFYVPDKIRQCPRLWEGRQHVHMICYSPYFHRNPIQAFDDATYILKYAWQIFGTHFHTGCLHMENKVNVNFYK